MIEQMRQTAFRTSSFVVDHMLGRLAKWLRSLGYDACYQQRYGFNELQTMLQDGRHLLTRSQRRKKEFPLAIYLKSDRVGEQLLQLQEQGLFWPPAIPFSRCIRCNCALVKSDPFQVIGLIPEYVAQTNPFTIKHCPSCGRHYWPGTHRLNMERQLKTWGIKYLPTLKESAAPATDVSLTE